MIVHLQADFNLGYLFNIILFQRRFCQFRSDCTALSRQELLQKPSIPDGAGCGVGKLL